MEDNWLTTIRKKGDIQLSSIIGTAQELRHKEVPLLFTSCSSPAAAAAAKEQPERPPEDLDLRIFPPVQTCEELNTI